MTQHNDRPRYKPGDDHTAPSDTIPDGAPVIVGGNLGWVIRAQTFGSAPGYQVTVPPETSLDGHTSSFAPDWCVKPAVIGANVCRKPRGQCFCGHVHVHAMELAWLPERAS